MKKIYKMLWLLALLAVMPVANVVAQVAKIGDTEYETLQAAFNAATDGQTVTLLADVDARSYFTSSTTRMPISKSMTINGNDHTVTVAGRGFGVGMNATGNVDVTFQNITIQNSAAGGRCIDTRGNIGTLTLYNATLMTGGGNFDQTLTIGGSQSTTATVNITNSTIQTNNDGTAYYAIVTFNPVNMTIESSTIKGWACIYAKGPDGSAGSAGSVFTVKDNSTLVSKNVYSGETNAFSAIMIADNDVTVNIKNSEVNITATGDQYQAITSFNGDFSESSVSIGEGCDVNLDGQKSVVAINEPNLTISGGTFNKPVPEDYCAEGYVCPIETDENGKYVIREGHNVATVYGYGFETLEDAFEVALDGATITLLDNVTLTDRLFVNAGATPAYAGSNNRYATTTENKSITLELDGHNITSSSNIALAGGSLNITNNGTADATHGVISTSEAGLAPVEIRGIGDLTQKRTLTVGEGVTLTGSTYGINVFGSNDAQKNIIDVNVNGTVKGTLFVLGNLKNAENEININVNGTINNDNNSAEVGIALNGYATVNVNEGANVSGETGIEVRAGKLIVNGGTITATASTYSEKANGSGSCTKGAAIAVAQHTTKLPIATTLSGGTLTGVEQLVITDVEKIGLNDVVVTATTSYTQQAEIPEGYEWKDNGNGTSTLTELPSVAQIGTTKYATLEAAVAAATDGATITLLDNVTLTNRLFVNAGATPAYAGSNNRYATTTENKSITLDMNGHNITSSSNIALAGGSLNITNTGTADATHGVISTSEAGLAPVEVRGTGELTQKRTLTVGTGVTLTGSTYGLNVFGSNTDNKNIIDVNVNGTVNGTLFVLGNLKNAENEININVNGTIKNDNNSAEVGIALNGNATVNVNEGANVSGETGIEVRAGKLIVNGGTITATASTYSEKANGSGSCTKGAAIAVAQHTTKLPIATTLSGGTLTGVEKLVITDVEKIGLNDVVVTATTSYTEEAEIPEGYKWESNGDGTSKLVEDIIVLTDGTEYTNAANIVKAKVAYKRTFGNNRVNKYQAWMVPFDYTLTATDVANFDFYEINKIEYAEQGNTTKMQIRLSSAKAAGDELTANMPYVFMPKSAVGEYTFKAEGVTLFAADGTTVRKPFDVEGVKVNFYSVYQNTKPTDENYIYYASINGKVGYANNADVTNGFAGVGPFRWIFKISGVSSSTAFTFGFAADEDDDVTAVSSAAADSAESEVVGYYTLSGQKVSEPTKGVYVVKYANGTSKKVVF